MANKAPLEVELPGELIRHYKEAFAASSDMRLLILLLFNAFEEIMKSFVAWRLGCHVDELPELPSRSLFDLTLVGPSAKDLRKVTRKFSELRNAVAHEFHMNGYEEKLKVFVESLLKHPCPDSEEEKREDLIHAFRTLAFDVVDYMDGIQPRGRWPFPFLSLELNE